MPIKIYRPTSAGRRNASVSTFEEITRSKPERSLLSPITRKGGRNSTGSITTRHQGGGHKRRYRLIDFRRNKIGVQGRIDSIGCCKTSQLRWWPQDTRSVGSTPCNGFAWCRHNSRTHLARRPRTGTIWQQANHRNECTRGFGRSRAQSAGSAGIRPRRPW